MTLTVLAGLIIQEPDRSQTRFRVPDHLTGDESPGFSCPKDDNPAAGPIRPRNGTLLISQAGGEPGEG